MKQYTLKKVIDLNDSYDIIIIGGGPAGCAAAIAAARDGAKTLLLKQPVYWEVWGQPGWYLHGATSRMVRRLYTVELQKKSLPKPEREFLTSRKMR